ncbi:MAG TPA: type I 3-dehydroquinate dehydratase [Thermoplasmata archaeon]|jgi:shikimate 5-dehydrogenase/3-dehydroquinate dehydratase|nr:type I 3-dehydroquinate dehydratase [Thermoplasmata archaeon]
MSPGRPSIVVSLPARTVADARREIVRAGAAGAEVAEVRIDRWAAGEVDRLAELFPSPLPLVATLRSRAEGGEGPDDPTGRMRLLQFAAPLPFRYLDVERSRDFPWAETLVRPGLQELIVSTHLPSDAAGSVWGHLVREPAPSGAIVKVVGAATVGRLLHEILPALPPPGERPFVAHTTGPSGPLLRAWSKRLGFPFVYAALPETSEGSSPAPVEPSQIPVDRLRPFLDAEGTPPIFAVVGHPVAHSRSPSIFTRWMRDDRRPGLYVALDFADDREFTDSIPALLEGGLRGLSVTHPFKTVAAELADEVGPGANACGVANVLTFGPDGASAENTDLVAIMRRLEELRASEAWDGTSIGVVGAGGAARATLAAARSLGTTAFVWARRREAREVLEREFGAHGVESAGSARPTLVVHATTVGRVAGTGARLPDLDWIRAGVHVVDWVYAPDDPVVRRTAERTHATYEDGTRLLAYQAAASYGLWWGAEPSAERIAATLESFR